MAQLTQKEKMAIAITIAGEISPSKSPYGDPRTDQEIANIIETIETRANAADKGRFGAGRGAYTNRADVVFQPQQYSTWNDAGKRQTALDNYAKFGPHIIEAIDRYYDGELEPTNRGLTHYMNKDVVKPGSKHWSTRVDKVAEVGPHTFYSDPGYRAMAEAPARNPQARPDIERQFAQSLNVAPDRDITGLSMAQSMARPAVQQASTTLDEPFDYAGFVGRSMNPVTAAQAAPTNDDIPSAYDAWEAKQNFNEPAVPQQFNTMAPAMDMFQAPDVMSAQQAPLQQSAPTFQENPLGMAGAPTPNSRISSAFDVAQAAPTSGPLADALATKLSLGSALPAAPMPQMRPDIPTVQAAQPQAIPTIPAAAPPPSQIATPDIPTATPELEAAGSLWGPGQVIGAPKVSGPNIGKALGTVLGGAVAGPAGGLLGMLLGKQVGRIGSRAATNGGFGFGGGGGNAHSLARAAIQSVLAGGGTRGQAHAAAQASRMASQPGLYGASGGSGSANAVRNYNDYQDLKAMGGLASGFSAGDSRSS